jgi:hypothetical protein
VFQKLASSLTKQKSEQREAELYRNLIRHEARIGGHVFGAIPAGRRREFFCLDERTWVWHEEWRDEKGQHHVRTTRYDVRPDGVLKAQNGHYQRLSDDEAGRLRKAAEVYVDRVKREMYASVAA